MTIDIQRTITCDGKGGARWYEDAGIACTEALDIVFVVVVFWGDVDDDKCFTYAYQGMVDEIPLYCLTKQVIEISGKILNSLDEGNLPCVVITVLSDNE